MKTYIKRYYYVNPSVFKFDKLLTSYDKKKIINICKYMKEAFAIRNSIINNMPQCN